MPDGREAVVVGRYPLRTEAYDRALVISSMEIPYWILPLGDGVFSLCVEPRHAEAVSRELAAWEHEHRQRSAQRPRQLPLHGSEKHPTISLFVAGWVMALLFLLQINAAPAWREAGASASEAIVQRGEWWRVITALTLHGDIGHLGANLAIGLVYAAFLLPLLGGGWTWLLILASGALGNWVNAWGHRGETHISIGASTAVFGALGILAGAQCACRLLETRELRWREILVPIGAGFALLAYLGVGDEGSSTDITAHLCGLLVGLPLGAAGRALRLKERTPRAGQILLGLVTLALLALAWAMATGQNAGAATAGAAAGGEARKFFAAKCAVL